MLRRFQWNFCASPALRLAVESALTFAPFSPSRERDGRKRRPVPRDSFVLSETSLHTPPFADDLSLPPSAGELPLPYDLNERMHDDDPDSSDNEEEHREVERANSRTSRIVSNGTTASRRRAPTADFNKPATEGDNPLDWRTGPY